MRQYQKQPHLRHQIFYGIQALRGIAALLVVMHHYNEVFLSVHKLRGDAGDVIPWLLSFGHLNIFGAIGVPIFFVISGFVIGLQLYEPGLRGAWSFMVKRTARIAPLYWIATLACIVLGRQWDFISLLQSLLFVRIAPDQLTILGPGWSLENTRCFSILPSH